nr:hypothetical protein [uncultured bacterium]BAH89891.1 hypothetical protein [uncultured bacterium]BAH90142.1 hypothetical protein [uncultured bacterium]
MAPARAPDMHAHNKNPRPGGPRAGASDWDALYSANSIRGLPEPANGPSTRLLLRLEGVRQTGADRWVARCPAHADRRPSLSLREGDDGRLLVHCWAGCTAVEIVAAAGLTLSDLFEKPLTHYAPAARRPWHDAGLEALRALADEITFLFVMAALLAGGLELTDTDRDRLILAAERLNGALALIEGGRARG